ncbi:cupin domain-containing protein [Methylobacterium sp. NEAU 140]|uniref:cupin domain-containing protein n=1 Tax=Methylobacterium sp. NEAU 140 TaxID=3064945 RepID=UPI0027351F2D|nr:cupin domain-containing protein [Methylobacterium sp. NEAU 140]MDP4024628.1 cupin domain-containing protein [Methylobacterium sp. NEAU 140]
MQIFHGRAAGAASESRGPTFTGQVWADPVMPATGGVMINNVFFTPGARTHWHTHGQGQILQVVAGTGWVCVDGERARPIGVGDTVWIPAGERHWHGAAADSYLLHTAISLGGTDWQDAVVDAAYRTATA